MKKAILLLCTFMTVVAIMAQGGSSFSQGDNGTKNRRVSSNGKYLVGEYTNSTHTWGLDVISGYESFLQNTETGETTWLTLWDDSDYEEAGSFTDVSDEGIICGTTKDTNNLLTVTEWGETHTLPLNSAAIWTKEGEKTTLGMGTYTPTDFTSFNDGSYATAISQDASVVAGYIAINNCAYVYPCRWSFDDATNKYVYKAYALPEGCPEAKVKDLSADGSIAVGYCRTKNDFYACWWPSPDECRILDDGTATGKQGSQAYVISDNGNFIGVTVDGIEPKIYTIGLSSYRTIGSHESAASVEINGITDECDVYGAYKYQDGRIRPFWHYTGWVITTDFSYFIYRFANDANIPYNFDCYSDEELSFCGVSADGKVIAGNDRFGVPWLLKIDRSLIIDIPPTINDNDFTATFADLGCVKVSFKRNFSERYMLYTAKEYVIYRDGKETGCVSVNDLDANGKETVDFTDTNVSRGRHYYSVAINYTDTRDDSELLSPQCEEKSVYMDASFDFPLYDNFDTGSIYTNGWSVQRDYGETLYQNWGCAPHFGFNASYYLHTSVDQLIPYSYSLVSRHLDAREKDEVYISFARKWMYANSRDWDLSKDSLSLEVSSDGIEWNVVKDLMMKDIIDDRWSFEYFDLTPYAAGKIFQVRFRLHGQALAQYVWSFENITIDDKPQHEGMKDILSTVDADGNFRMIWKNSLDAYPMSYLQNPYDNANWLAIGNEGKELIAVNRFDATDLTLYKGKYITSITTEINKYESEDLTPVRAAIVVYENGKLVREQEISEPQYNTDFTVKLDEPILIDGTKELMFGLKLLEHGADQCPIVYHNTKQFVDGKSNLYSEDGGMTWKSLADFYATVEGYETNGYASWVITANVTDTPEMTKNQIDDNLFAYEIYKNGQKYSNHFVYLLEPGFTDENSVTGDTYEIRTFFYDGTVSELSERITNDGTNGINVVENDKVYGIDGNILTLNEGNDHVALYNAEGKKLYEGRTSSLNLNKYGKGIYMLVICDQYGNRTTHKFVF